MGFLGVRTKKDFDGGNTPRKMLRIEARRRVLRPKKNKVDNMEGEGYGCH